MHHDEHVLRRVVHCVRGKPERSKDTPDEGEVSFVHLVERWSGPQDGHRTLLGRRDDYVRRRGPREERRVRGMHIV